MDNRTGFSIPSHAEDFITSITPINNLNVKGIRGGLKDIGKGTITWNVSDNNGINHKIVIAGPFYVKQLK